MKTALTMFLVSGFWGLLNGAVLNGTILLDHDTLNVTIKVPLGLFNRQPVLHNLRSKIIYFNRKGERKVLKAKDAQEVIFQFENETIHLVSKPNPFSINKRKPRYYFLKLVENGSPLKLFIFYDESTSNEGMTTEYTERYFIQKHHGALVLIGGINFRKIMLEIVGDCPQVAQKIKSRAWRKRDLELIVKYYNNHCAPSRILN